jgi:hypothetical protein
MKNEQNRSVEIILSVPMYLDLHQIKHLDPTHSIDILLVFTLITGINKLWLSIDKMRKQGKCDLKLILQAVGAIGVILKAIDDRFNRDDEDKDE